MRIALYARKSTEQEDRQVQSLDDQIRELTSIAAREQHDIAEIFIEAKSASTPGKRPEFERLMHLVENGHLDGILTWNINRLSRNPIDAGRIAYALQTGRISFIRTYERVYRPEDNAILIAIDTGMATQDIQSLRTNVKRGMRGRVERGWHAHLAPLGYRNDPSSRTIVKDSERFEMVRYAWDLLLSGQMSVRQITDELTAVGLTIPRGVKIPKEMSRTCLYGIFRNRFYAGDIWYDGQWLPGKQDPMISPLEFLRAQSILDRTRKLRSRTRSFAFQGVFTCAECGCAVVAELHRKTYKLTHRTVDYIYYHCSGNKGCPKNGVKEIDIVKSVEAALCSIRLNPAVQPWLESAIADSLRSLSGTNDKSIEAIQTRIAEQRARFSSLVQLRISGEISVSEFSRERDNVNAQILTLQTESDRLRSTLTQLTEIAQSAIDLAVQAGELASGFKDIRSLGLIAPAIGKCIFVQGAPVIEVRPILAEMADLEPLEVGSRSVERDSKASPLSLWSSKLDRILNLLVDESMHMSAKHQQVVRERSSDCSSSLA